LQGTYETFAAAARKHFGGTLQHTITVTAGLGGMGGAQPLAVTLNGGVVIAIDVDPTLPFNGALKQPIWTPGRPMSRKRFAKLKRPNRLANR
jgi:hypothetical protein